MVITNKREAVEAAKGKVTTKHKEHFIALYLNARNKLICSEVVSIGTLNASLVHPREVFRPAIVKRAAHVIALHNHPSGEVEPSDDDIAITKRLGEAGKIIGIRLLDSVIFSDKGDSYSLMDNNLM